MQQSALFLDRDGVININHGHVHKRECFDFIDGVIDVARYAHQQEHKLVVITNQAGIATGEVQKKDLNKINLKIKSYLKTRGINLIKFYVSEHHYNSDSFFRKPNPGNFIKAAKEYKILLDKKHLAVLCGLRNRRQDT